MSADSLDIKSMILMPGPLTLSHAKEEKNCDSCHSNFDKSAQNSKCLTCHEPVAEDQQLKKGFHGLDAMASKNECKSCHTDHKGRDFNIVPFDIDIFDHTHTDFPLLGKHASAACGSCHLPNTAFRDTATTCYGCHREQDKHRGSLGEECGDCHSSDAWNKPETFDHDSTEFPLHGSHVELQCSSCHAGGQYTFDNTQCVACHQLRDVHLGRYGQDCQRCHSEENWTSPVFDHAAETQFPLRGAHHSLTCQACHFGDLKQTKLSTQCVSCHRSSDIHTGRHGDKCDSCHNTTNWDEARFDHAKEANWPLLGKHEKLSCLQCHQGSLKDSPGNQCIDCHRADDAHKTQALNSCGACHQPTGWRDTDGFDHELAQFPLEGMHAVVPCQGCHESDEFHEAKKECVDCHDAEDPHKSALGQQCGSCHTPNGWLLWTFDHNNATDFRLDGAHAHLSCGSCHRGKEAADVPGDCAGCHASEDRHEGRFGRDCSRCHSTESFGAVQWRK
ncbi:MAG: cytochrome c3 family protein [Halioglobus sp.]